MAIAPRGFLVKSPKCTDPPKYGLLSVVDPITPGDPHWMAGGIEWEDFLCGPPATGFIDNCPPATGYTKPPERGSNFCSADPFVAYGSYDCPPVGRETGEAFEIARQRLINWEGYQVENILWTGQSANGPVNPSFAFGNPDCGILPIDLSPAGALDPVSALALLEHSVHTTVACGGFVHLPDGFMPFMIEKLRLEPVGDAYFSPGGLRLVSGRGYPGSGPGNVPSAPGETWLFATGPLVMTRGNVMMVPENISEAVNRQINDVTVRAERFYSVGFSCALFAVRAKLSPCECC